jgi:UDP-2,4-diacetamido-2,4,6-trideoxy-beta-L-altropyranose hydrolase
VFRADASTEIGGGHVMRCLALANALQSTGWDCAFATDAKSRATIPALAATHALTLAGSADDEPAALARHWPGGCDLLVVDHYRRDAAFERACRPWARRIMAIDDLADRQHDCDLLLDQSPGRMPVDYAALTPDHCTQLLGPAYALLRPEFARLRKAALDRRRLGGPVRRILVALGATDPHDVTSRVLRGVAACGVDAAIDIVLGADAPHIAAVRKLIATLPQPVTLHLATPGMALLMAEADLGIGAAGTTSWERCCLGLPSLVVTTAANQNSIATGLAQAGAARVLGDHRALSEVKITGVVASLTGDEAARRKMTDNAARLCDGLGGDRVLLTLAGAASSAGGQQLRLRLATPDDTKLMYEWQHHPDTRRYARNPAVPCRMEHEQWMEQVLNNPETMLAVIMSGDAPAGVLRLDIVDSGAAREISIYVAPTHYRRGIGAAALDLACRVYPGWELHAEIHSQNTASRMLFAKAGYRKIAPTRFVKDPLVHR